MKVFLCKPKIADEKEFLHLVGKSSSLHMPWVQPPDNKEKYKDYIERINSNCYEGFFIRLIKTNEIVGVININEIVHGCFQSGYLGFYAFYSFHGKGLMSEGLSLVLANAFNNLNLHRLEANIQPGNFKSIAFIKNNNFRHEGFSEKYLKIDGEWQDHQRFAITIEDYQNDRNSTI